MQSLALAAALPALFAIGTFSQHGTSPKLRDPDHRHAVLLDLNAIGARLVDVCEHAIDHGETWEAPPGAPGSPEPPDDLLRRELVKRHGARVLEVPGRDYYQPRAQISENLRQPRRGEPGEGDGDAG